MSDTSLGLSIAGVDMVMRTDAELRDAVAASTFAGFVCAVRRPALRLAAARLPLAARMPSTPPRARLVGSHLTVEQGDIFALDLELEEGTGTLHWAPSPVDDRLAPEPPLHWQSGLKTACACLLAWQGALLLHASAVVVGGETALFVGRSGAGKSTIAGMFPPHRVLNDELIGVRVEGGAPVAFASPFSGTLAAPRRRLSAPVGRGFALQHAPALDIVPLDAAAALRLVLQCTALPEQAEALEQRAFGAAVRLTVLAPWSRLAFAREGKATTAGVRRALRPRRP